MANLAVAFTIPTPVVAYNNGDSINITMQQLVATPRGAVTAAMPMATVQAVITAQPRNAIAAVMPALVDDIRLGARVTSAMPMGQLALTGTTTVLMRIGAVMPLPQIGITGTKTGAVNVAVTMPTVQAAMRVANNFDVGMPSATAAVTGRTGSVIRISATMPMGDATLTATSRAFAAVSAAMPLLVPGPYGRIVSVMPIGQVSLTARTVVAVTYEAYAVNLNHTPKPGVEPVDEVTRYTNYPFSQIVRYQNKYYGVADTGLYELTGTTDYAATPTAIPWAFKTAMTDDKVDEKKTVRALRFSGRVGPAATITLYSGESGNEAYAYTTPRDATPQNHREKFGRGIKGRYYAVGVSGTGVLNLDGLEPEVDKLTRKL